MAEESSRIKELFQQALDRPPQERSAFLDASCGDDRDLRTKVDTLLQALESAGEFLAERESSPAKEGERPGTVIDRYKLLQEIGEGGFGVVWLAEQTAPVRRKVALKVIKVGMDTKQVVARFEAERQALAMMDHPNIAKVFDAGATAAGRPYFVMELVRGVPITTYCDQAQLNPRERIELFLRVCHAAQHAHQKGVIHRDLKPNNILVTLQDGIAVPKVIDFGIAKATSQELTQKTLFTELKQIVGTPEYMAPEQAEMSGLDVDTRTDVYSLGVTLYELLTGTRPFEIGEDQGFLELLRRVVEVEPSKPSTRLNTLGDRLPVLAKQRQTEPHKLQRLLRGDLDWVVMKALSKSRSQRYPTASALLEDLQRYLDDLPVEAGRPGALYRSLKFCHRHRLAVGAAVAFAALLVVTAAISTGFAVEAVQARDEAQQQTNLTLQQAYVANIFAAEAALRNQDTKGAALRLAATDEDLRGWEWHYLNGRVDSSVWTADPLGTKATAIAFHPDDSQSVIASSWRDGRVRVYEADTGRLIREMVQGRGGIVGPMVFGADGRILFVGDEEGGIAALNWSAGGEVALEGHKGVVSNLAVSPDGNTLASSSWDGTVGLWDTESHERKMTLPHACETELVTWSPDGKALAAVSWDQTFTLWDATSGEMISRQSVAMPGTDLGDSPVRWGPGNVETIEFDPSSQWVATGCRDGSIAVWDARSGVLVFRDRAHGALIRDLEWSPDGTRLAAASLDRTTSLWDTESWSRIATLRGHSDDVRSVAFHPRGEVFATISWDRSVKLWKTDGTLRGTMLGHGEGIYKVTFSPDGKYLATFSEDGTLKVWETLVGFMESIHAQTEGGWVYSVAFAMHDLLATSDVLGSVRIWNLGTGLQRIDPIDHEPGIYSLAMHPRGFTLATTSSNRNGEADYDIRLWDLRTEETIRTLTGHQGSVRHVTFSDDGALLASASDDGTVRIWDQENGVELLRLEGHDRVVREVAFLPGERIVSCSEDGTARVWNGTNGELLRRIDCDSDVFCLAVHPDGSTVALGCVNRTIFLHDLESGERLASFQGHAGAVTSLAWLPDGSRLVSGSEDRTVRLWDPVTGENVATLLGHSRQVRTVAVSSDGNRIASGGEDSVVHLWNR